MSVLSDELANDPKSIGYSGMTDEEAAESLNAKTRPGVVPYLDVVRYLTLAGKWANIVDTSIHETLDADKRKVALNMVETIKNFETFDLQDALNMLAVQTQLANMKAAELIDATDETTILALENNRRTRAQELGIEVNIGDIKAARAQ